MEAKESRPSATYSARTPFSARLERDELTLRRGRTENLQINVGFKCNLNCAHCHLEAGPDRVEMMDEKTVEDVLDYARRVRFRVVDITGGAPEMNPNLNLLIEKARPIAEEIIVRSNLTLLRHPALAGLVEFFRANEVSIVGSLPSLEGGWTDRQRGSGAFDESIETLRFLNAHGYGIDESARLHLALNPVGAFLAPDQSAIERRFRQAIKERHGIEFNELFSFANVPVGRFGSWLERSENLESYYDSLETGFNRSALDGVMCRYQISVDWRGYLYDCDFHLAAQRGYRSGAPRHVSDPDSAPVEGEPIALDDHCYTCMAGSGFTCAGAIE